MPISLWKILITGKDIQGVNLRESIYDIAKDHKNFTIKGFVRNLKHDNKVEIFCLADDDKLKKFVEEINKLNKKPIEMELPLNLKRLGDEQLAKDTFGEKAFESFEIERADDLREMVWALQGAGKIFLWTAKKETESKLGGLRNELLTIQEYAGSFKLGIDKNWFRISAIHSFMIAPPLEYKYLLKQLGDLLSTCQQVNKLIMLDKKENESEIGGKVDKIRWLATTILERIPEESETNDSNKNVVQ